MARQNRQYGDGRHARSRQNPARPARPGNSRGNNESQEEQEPRQKRPGLGNKLGWIIAGALVGIFLIILILFVALPQPSSPRETRDKSLLAMVTVDHWPGSVVGPKPTGGGNAGDDYARAISLYRAHRRELDDACYHLDDIRTGAHQLPESTLRVMEQIHQAVSNGARKASAKFVLTHTAAFRVSPKYGPSTEVRMAFEILKALFLIYEHKMGKHAEARQVAHDAFCFGWHLMEDRGHINIVLCGLEIQYQTLGLFQGLDPSGPQGPSAPAIYRYAGSLNRIRTHYKKKMEILYGNPPYPGDVFNIAENDQDPAWRVHAALTLGVLKHTAGRRGDKRYTAKLIDRYSDSDDARMASAAKAADGFAKADFEQYKIPDLYEQPDWPPGAIDYYFGPSTPAGMLFRDE